MGHRKLRGIVRHRIGSAAHRAGAATRGDIQGVQAELQSIRDELGLLSRWVTAEIEREPLAGLPWGVRPSDARAGSGVPSRPLTRRPRVSVVIPCFNYARFLPAAVGSVTGQAEVEVDVLIIDDCSSDDTREVAESLAEDDERIRVAVHPENVGHIATYNEGISAAEAEYLVLLSADDLLTPGSLARATALLDAHPSVSFVYGSTLTFNGNSIPPARQTDAGWTIWEGRDWIQERCRVGGNDARSPEVVMRTSVQRQIGPYRAELPHSADMEMWLRAAAVGEVGRVEGADQAFYRLHADNLTGTLCVRPTDDLRARHDAFAAAFTTPPVVHGAERLYGQARWALAVEALRKAAEGYSSLATDEVEELEDFALEMVPSARDTSQWLQLELRRSAAALTSPGARPAPPRG